MVTFQELRITPDGQKLIIDVSVKDLEYYTNVYLDTIQIDTQDTFVESGPSSKVVYTKVIGGDTKSVRLELGTGDLLPTLNDNLFFVYVRTKGTPSMDTPCGMDNSITLGTVLNKYPIYSGIMQYVKEVNNDCTMPKNFIDKYLRFQAFEISVITGHYTEAIKYYNKFIKGIGNTGNTSNSISCGCYG